METHFELVSSIVNQMIVDTISTKLCFHGLQLRLVNR